MDHISRASSSAIATESYWGTPVAFVLLYALGDPKDALLIRELLSSSGWRTNTCSGLITTAVEVPASSGGWSRAISAIPSCPTEAVTRMIGRSFPNTLQLAVSAQLLAVLISIPLGSLAAHRRINNRSSLLDRAVVLFVSLGQSMPWFYIALLLIFGFGVTLHVLPVWEWGYQITWSCPL